MLRDQIRGERQQEQQHNLRCRFIAAPAAEEAHRAPVQPADHKARENTADRHLEELHRRAADGKDHGAHRHRNGELQGDQAGGIVHQRFALQNAHYFFRNAPFADNSRQRHGIRWRQNRRQSKSRNQRNTRHDPVDEVANTDHRYHHQRQRQTENFPSMLYELTGWRLPAIGKKQRRNEQNQKEFGVEFNVQSEGRPGQQRADANLD